MEAEGNEKFAGLVNAPYLCVKSLEKGVNIIGITRGEETKFHHTEKLDKDEVLIFQFTEHTSAMKIRGKAEIYTEFGVIKTFDETDEIQ